MHVVTDINGRGALPVRAIPLLTDWRGLSPDQLAQILAGGSDHWPSFDGLTAYRLQTDGSIEAIPPRWWQSWVVRKLNATSDAIKAKQTSHETGYQQWRSESLAQLPSGVFVWRDEFEVAHVCEYGPLGRRARGNPNGFDSRVHVLNFNPHPDLDIAPHGLVLEGFDELKAENEKELHLHDVRISLKSWATLHDVRPNDAALLLCGYDPDKGQSHTAKDFLMLARCFTDHAQKYPAPRRLAQWWALVLEWTEAKKLGFTTPNRDIGEALMIFDKQHHPRTESAPAQPAESDSTPVTPPAPVIAASASNPPLVAGGPDDGEAWKVKARDRANEIIKRQRERDLHPSQINIADEIAREFREGGIVGAGGKPLTGAYIKRHAIKGISSAKGRQLSTSIRRGK